MQKKPGLNNRKWQRKQRDCIKRLFGPSYFFSQNNVVCNTLKSEILVIIFTSVIVYESAKSQNEFLTNTTHCTNAQIYEIQGLKHVILDFLKTVVNQIALSNYNKYF